MRLRGLTPRAILQLLRPQQRSFDGTRHVFICIGDHYEPMWQRPSRNVQRDRVQRWVDGYPKMAQGLADSRGRPPQHIFFYPQDEYDPELVEPIAKLCQKGFGDMEVHLHHDNDTADGLREKMLSFTHALHHEHGMLRRDAQGRLSYAFIHGNWALNNCRPDGRWCGVNDEITILRETGCYADMTMPSAPALCQTSTLNSIYYAQSTPDRPNGHDRGIASRVGSPPPENHLLLIQGSLALDYSQRKWGVLPKIENGDLTGIRPPTMDRFQLWLQAGVQVKGRSNWHFIKLHTHGAQEANAAMLLGEPMRQFHQELAQYAQQEEGFYYYYVTAFEMAGLVRQAEQGIEVPDFAALHGLSRTAESATNKQRDSSLSFA